MWFKNISELRTCHPGSRPSCHETPKSDIYSRPEEAPEGPKGRPPRWTGLPCSVSTTTTPPRSSGQLWLAQWCQGHNAWLRSTRKRHKPPWLFRGRRTTDEKTESRYPSLHNQKCKQNLVEGREYTWLLHGHCRNPLADPSKTPAWWYIHTFKKSKIYFYFNDNNSPAKPYR